MQLSSHARTLSHAVQDDEPLASISSPHISHSQPHTEHEGDDDDEDVPVSEPRHSSSWEQFLAGVQRTIRQKRRRPFTTVLEMLVPVLFAVVLLVLCLSFMEVSAETAFMNNSVYINGSHYNYYFCYNTSVGEINGLLPCSTDNSNVMCVDREDYPYIPVDGLCSIDGSSRFLGFLMGFADSARGNPMGIESLDDIIIAQWVAQVALRNQSSASSPLLQLVSALGVGTSQDSLYHAILNSGKLHFAPRANIPEDLIEYFTSSSHFFRYVQGEIFDTVKEAREYVTNSTEPTWAIISIENITSEFQVDISLAETSLPRTPAILSPDFTGAVQYNTADMYLSSGLVYLQKVLYTYYGKKLNAQHIISVPGFRFNFQYPVVVHFNAMKSYRNRVVLQAGPMISFVTTMAFLYPFIQMVKTVALNRELRIREATSIMGLRRTPMYLSYFFLCTLQGVVTVSLFTLVLFMGISRSSNYFILWLIFFVYYLTMIPLAAIVGACFNSARFATQMAPVLYFVIAMPAFVIETCPATLKCVLSLISPVSVALMYTNYLTFSMGSGFSWASLLFPYLSVYPIVFLLFLCADVVLYIILMLYMDHVTSGNYGPAHHPLFFVVEPFCALRRCVSGRAADAEAAAPLEMREGLHEERERRSRRVVELDGLVKTYERGGKTFRAVDKLRWGMDDCEISVLLGENGAGKSTTVNMLTGMERMDGGDCRVEGFSVRRELGKVRQRLGYCPQHNILWPDLTCREHLEYYGKLKGLHGSALKTRVAGMLELVDLVEKADALSCHLSGGQKRKLSVAIAFVGGNALVILDEPTAGMDAAARRHTWQLLRLMSSQSAVLLTTHFLDEADLLGDHIGIMQGGQLRCSGSSLYLKSRLGRGYTLRVELERADRSDAVGRELRTPLPALVTLSENEREKLFSVPKESYTGMPAALRVLETRGAPLGVRGFAVSATTLEEVFLTVVERCTKGEDLGEEVDGDDGGNVSVEEVDPYAESGDVGNTALRKGDLREVWMCCTEKKALNQFKAVVRKKWRNSLRDRRLLFLQIIFPVVAAGVAMLLQLIDVLSTNYMPYDVSLYKSETVLPYSVDCYSLLGAPMEWNTAVPSVQHVEVETETFEELVSYLSQTYYSHSLLRFSAFQCSNGAKVSDSRADPLNYGLFYNSSSTSSVVVAMAQFYHQLIMNGMRQKGESVESAVSYPFLLSSSVLPKNKYSQKVATKSSISVVMISLILIIPFTFLPAMPAGWVVKERECKARHMQRLAGLTNRMYWVGNFVFDMGCYLLTEILVILILVIFRRTAFVGSNTFLPFAVGTLVYGVCSTVVAYFLSFFFSEHTSAQHTIASLSFVTGFILLIVMSVVDILAHNEKWCTQLRFVCRVFPSFCIGDIFMNLAYLDVGAMVGSTPWSMNIVGWPCVFMAVETTICGLIIFLLEHPMRPYYTKKILHRIFRTCFPEAAVEEDDIDAAAIPSPLAHSGTVSPAPGSSMRFPHHERGQSILTVVTNASDEVTPVLSTLRRERFQNPNPPHFWYQSFTSLHSAQPSCPGGNEPDYQTPIRDMNAAHFPRTHSRTFSMDPISERALFRTPIHVRGLTQSNFYNHRHEESVVNLGRRGELLRLNGEDSDVEDERLAVRQDIVLKRRDPVQVLNVRKVYPGGVVAVRSLSFSVMKGEVFALLGTNGSGKTTTMSMLCQEQAPTRGKLYVDGHHTVRESEAARQRIGYCPQFDATLDLLTVREHLELYADIHGVVGSQREGVVTRLMEVCGITAFGDVLSKDLSGGNRRKLSVAMCLIGGPSVVCLDEPSAGMDPLARRKLWESILTIAKQCSVLLTTHHMEEVEALANCVGIMSRGTLRCLGDLQHLKRKYGSGYEVSLRVSRVGRENTWGTEADEVEEFVARALPGCVIDECFRGERYVLSLPAEATVLSKVFEVLQENQERLGITDFIVSQTSIEQVFLRFCEN